MNTLIRSQLHAWLDDALLASVENLAAKGTTPARFIAVAALAAAAGSCLLACGYLRIAAVVLISAGALRLLGETGARVHGAESSFSRFVVSCLDNIVEGVVLVAVAVYLSNVSPMLPLLLVLAALLSNYVKARAEALGLQCNVGIATQPERIVLLSLALLTGWLGAAVELLLALTLVTICQQIWFVRGALDTEW